MRLMCSHKRRMPRQDMRTRVLPMLEAEARMQRGQGKQEEKESSSRNVTTKGQRRTGQGMDEVPAFNPDNGGVRRVGIGSKGDYKGDGMYSDGI